MGEITKETKVRAIVVNIETPYNAFVMDEIITNIDFLDEALEGYKDLTKYRIVKV